MLSAHLLRKDTKLLLQQPEYNNLCLVIKGLHSTSVFKRGKHKVSKFFGVCSVEQNVSPTSGLRLMDSGYQYSHCRPTDIFLISIICQRENPAEDNKK